jgi:hypothetical protein
LLIEIWPQKTDFPTHFAVMKFTICLAALAIVSSVNGFTFVAPSRASTRMFSETEEATAGDDVAATPAAPAFKAGFKKGQVSN